MIVTPRIFVRLAAIVVGAVLVQLAFFSRVAVLDTSPDILPALVVCFGLLGGTMAGVVCGFAVGFLLDCLLVQPLGASSLVLLTVGYLAGMYRERFDIQGRLTPLLLCMGLTLVAELGFGATEAVVGIDAPVSLLAARDMILKALFAFVLAWPLYAGLCRLLRPALVDEERTTRRRRRPTVLGA